MTEKRKPPIRQRQIYNKRLVQAEKRIGELDRLFIKIYADNAKGDLSDECFAMMSRVYEDERKQLKIEVKNLQREIEAQEQQIENLEQFINRVHRLIPSCRNSRHTPSESL